MLANKINVEDALKFDSCSYLAYSVERKMLFLSKQTHVLDYFICYHLESGWHMTRPNQGLSLGKGKSLGMRLHMSQGWCVGCMQDLLGKVEPSKSVIRPPKVASGKKGLRSRSVY